MKTLEPRAKTNIKHNQNPCQINISIHIEYKLTQLLLTDILIACLLASVIKNLPANPGDTEDKRSTPGWEDLLEEEMPIHSSILAWEIPWTEEAGELQFLGFQRVGQDLATERVHAHLKEPVKSLQHH